MKLSGRAAILALALAFCVCSSALHAIELGDNSPHLSLTKTCGDKLSLDSLRGKVVYLDIWASWCGTCANSIAWLNQLQQRYGKDGLAVVAVNVDEDRRAAEAMIKNFNPHTLVTLDPNGEVPAKLNVQAMPTSLLIGRNGKVISIHEGLTDSNRKEIERLIARELLDTKPI